MGMLKCVIYRYLNPLSIENRWASSSFFYKDGRWRGAFRRFKWCIKFLQTLYTQNQFNFIPVATYILNTENLQFYEVTKKQNVSLGHHL